MDQRLGRSNILDGLPYARSRQVVVIAQFAERNSAAFRATVGTDRSTTVGALLHGSLAARHSYVVISEFNLQFIVPPPHMQVQKSARRVA